MAQIRFRGNLDAANFPFVSDFWGRTVVIGQNDENFIHRQRLTGNDPDSDLGVPQVYYCHNVAPTGQGFKSVAYDTILTAYPAETNFDIIIPVRNPDMTRGLMGFTTDGHVYIYCAGDKVWTKITGLFGGWTGTAVHNISYGYANGYTYVCLQNFGVYKIDVFNRTASVVTFIGVTMTDIVALCDAAGYLVITDGVTVYWSSTINVEDFTPSLTTGAGSGGVNDISGKIVTMVPLGSGYAVFSSANVVIASYSGNARYPWQFRQANGSKGITSAKEISFNGDEGVNYAWTAGGIQKISTMGTEIVFPETTDFLASKIFEDFDTTTDTFSLQYLTSQLNVRISYIGSRFLIISYGVTSQLTHALLYDSAFKRWGKLKVNHVCAFEFTMNSEGAVNSSAASPKHTLAFLNNDGTISLVNFDYGNINSNSVLFLGKYQVSRARMNTLQQVDIESIANSSNNFIVKIFTTLDGKTFSTITTPILQSGDSRVKSYNPNICGMNHSILIKGAFNIVSNVLYFNVNGKR